jgi:hypothetical protein
MSAHDIQKLVCPRCSAELDVGDRTCPHCGARIEAPAPDAAERPGGTARAPQSRARGGPHRDVAESRWAVLLLLFAALGPLAFPVLWRSPKFSRTWKGVLTIAVSILTCVVVWILWYAIHMFVEALQEAGILAPR